MTVPLFRIGAQHPIQILILEPLFEEANRMRRTLAQVMRRLDADGIGSAIPDLPGTGESLTPITDATLDFWRTAVREAGALLSETGAMQVVASFRGGALCDDATGARAVWRLSPESGARIVRDMRRAARASEARDDGKLAGHRLSPAFVTELEQAIPVAGEFVRTVRLETDAASADQRIAGSPVWRRAEPGEDPMLTAAVHHALRDWVQTCVNG